MRSWFESLQAREKKFVIAAFIAVAFAILYLGIWRPLDRNHRQLETSVQTWRSAIADRGTASPAPYLARSAMAVTA